ncbi:MAG TPA: hypothetical protein VF988_03025 [Verrucomicrobiae bacterium]
MDADEREVYEFLRSIGDWVNSKEVCRRAGGKRRFAEDPYWARPVLQRLKELGMVEGDMSGRYRVVAEEEEEWVAPDIAKILGEGEEDKPAKGPGAGESSEEDHEQL